MRTRNNAGFTRNELIAVVVVVTLLALVIYPAISAAIDQAASTAMKSKGRGIWTAVLSASEERRLAGEGPAWPRELGFDVSRTSTEYFRQLMSDYPTGMTNGLHGPMCEDLKPYALGGAGVPCADSVAVFTSKNNAWDVVCVGTQTSANEQNIGDVPFLITRNVTVGRHVNALSSLDFNKRSPLRIRRCVYLTYGGACIDRRKEYLNAPSGLSCVLEGLGTNATGDVMFP